MDKYKDNNMPSLELARAYIPIQILKKIFEKEEALCRGTLYPELVRPYIGKNKDGRSYD